MPQWLVLNFPMSAKEVEEMIDGLREELDELRKRRALKES